MPREVQGPWIVAAPEDGVLAELERARATAVRLEQELAKVERRLEEAQVERAAAAAMRGNLRRLQRRWLDRRDRVTAGVLKRTSSTALEECSRELDRILDLHPLVGVVDELEAARRERWVCE